MQAPDSSWVGRCGPRAFLQLTHNLLQLVMLRDEDDRAILADQEPGMVVAADKRVQGHSYVFPDEHS
jgi:hypothetical protein